jgi:hypothetical protein
MGDSYTCSCLKIITLLPSVSAHKFVPIWWTPVQKHLADIFYLSKKKENVPAILAQGVMVFWLSYYISEGIHLAFFLTAISRLCFFLDSNEILLSVSLS